MVSKRLILAVAGSGKTRYVIESLCLEKRFLIITYTVNNYNTIRNRVIDKFGFLPPNIIIYKFFDFLYAFCTKPYAFLRFNLKGITWDLPPELTNRLPINNKKRFISNSNKLYHNRISKFLEVAGIIPKVIQKLEMFYDYLIIDEFQDLGGHDFNFILQISKANINLMYVGDYYQNTYVTSFDGNVNSNLYSNYKNYTDKIELNGISIDTGTLLNSYRCPPAICEFISNYLGINIKSDNKKITKIVVYEKDDNYEDLINNNSIVKLVYSNSKKYSFFSKNWGECKGEDDYGDTCIILTKSASKQFEQNKLHDLPSSTKNKLYVALSRTKGHCYIIKQ